LIRLPHARFSTLILISSSTGPYGYPSDRSYGIIDSENPQSDALLFHRELMNPHTTLAIRASGNLLPDLPQIDTYDPMNNIIASPCNSVTTIFCFRSFSFCTPETGGFAFVFPLEGLHRCGWDRRGDHMLGIIHLDLKPDLGTRLITVSEPQHMSTTGLLPTGHS
jgi:hypothetical protein